MLSTQRQVQECVVLVGLVSNINIIKSNLSCRVQLYIPHWHTNVKFKLLLDLLFFFFPHEVLQMFLFYNLLNDGYIPNRIRKVMKPIYHNFLRVADSDRLLTQTIRKQWMFKIIQSTNVNFAFCPLSFN